MSNNIQIICLTLMLLIAIIMIADIRDTINQQGTCGDDETAEIERPILKNITCGTKIRWVRNND